MLAVCPVIRCNFYYINGKSRRSIAAAVKDKVSHTSSYTEMGQLIESNVKGNEAAA